MATVLSVVFFGRASAEGEIIQASSLLEFANTTVADVQNATYLVDKDTGVVNDEESFVQVFGEEFPDDDIAAWATIEEDGTYLVSNGTRTPSTCPACLAASACLSKRR